MYQLNEEAAHIHSISITAEQALNLIGGTVANYSITSSEVNGHEHTFTVTYNSTSDKFEFVDTSGHGHVLSLIHI